MKFNNVIYLNINQFMHDFSIKKNNEIDIIPVSDK